MRSLSTVAGFFSAFILAALPVRSYAQDPVVFADPGLENAVRLAVGIPFRALQPADLVGVDFDRLDASGLGIVDLEGIEFATDLERLDLSNNRISELSPLQTLRSLELLNLSENVIRDLSGLEGITVRSLYLNENSISDLGPLATVSGIGDLFLDGNFVEDLTPLSNLTSLTQLTLDRNLLTSLEGLQALSQLRILFASNNDLEDISAYQPVGVRVSHVILNDNRIEFIEALALEEIRFLDLSGNIIRDLSPLQDVLIERLDLSRNRISDLMPLQNTVLDTLDLSDNQIRDLTPLSDATIDQHLILDDNEIETLDGLEMAGGGPLSLSAVNNVIVDINALSVWFRIYHLDLSNNRIRDLTGLPFFSDSPHVIVNKTHSGINTGYALINLADNAISELGPIVANTSIESFDVVDLRGNPLSTEALTVDLPILESRSVTVEYDGKPVEIDPSKRPNGCGNLASSGSLESPSYWSDLFTMLVAMTLLLRFHSLRQTDRA